MRWWSLKTGAIGLAFLAATLVFFSTGASQPQKQRDSSAAESTLPRGAVINGDYFAFGSLAEISGTVNGDVYGFAGQVIVDGQVNGDVLASGGRIRISGTVAQDVRAAGGQVSVNRRHREKSHGCRWQRRTRFIGDGAGRIGCRRG